MAKITVQTTDVTILKINDTDYISLTDIAKYKTTDANTVIANWLRNRMTIEYLGLWEILYNPHFKPLEFEGFRKEAGLNAFTLSPQKWIETTCAIGLISKSGRYGGTFAHKDIAFKFASWISVEFELYIVKEFQRLKEQEQAQIGWSAKRELSKINYHIHTDAIKQHLIPQEITPQQASMIYASEADILNVAMFGMTALEWRDTHPNLKGNIRDYASINELICYISDHGDMLGDHYHWRKTYPYQGSVHVPYIVKWPASYHFTKGNKITQPVELRDLLPTFLEIAGSSIPQDMDGQSLLRLMEGKTDQWRKYIDLEHATCYSPDNYWCALTDGKIKYIWRFHTGTEELFDLSKDPHELKNVVTDKKYKQQLNELRQAMIDHLSERGEKFVKDGKLQVLKQTILYSPLFPDKSPVDTGI